ncbi:MAG: aminoacyl-tRNA hydrolase [Thermomicrobiales bacterium]|nr:aminoacyl-tRNA hydrolase [Thermomicrobiales bacterium]
MREGDGDVWLVVGLGNPGRRYEGTRHNAGFMAVERLQRRLPEGTSRARFQAHIVETRDGDSRVVLAQPQTFMNESGIAVAQLVRWYKVPLDRLLVVYDDLDLPLGTIRLRADGSDGGHNGIASIIRSLKTNTFPRLRIGISRPASGPTVPYVLSRFNATERRELEDILDRTSDAILVWIREGLVSAMNQFNQKATVETKPKGA